MFYLHGQCVGNQLPILLIDFSRHLDEWAFGWESVTNPLDRLLPSHTIP